MSLGNLYVVYSSFFLYNFIEKLFNSCSFYRRWLFIRLCTNRWWMMWHHRRRSRRRRCRRTRARTRVYWTGCSIWSITATAVWTTTRAHICVSYLSILDLDMLHRAKLVYKYSYRPTTLRLDPVS